MDEADGFRYMLVIMDDLSNFTRLEPTESCTTVQTAKHLLTWRKSFGIPQLWVTEMAPHFNTFMTKIENAAKV